jgi:hypothetical protein
MDRITHQPPRQQGYGSTSSLRNDSLKHTQKHERRKESKQGTKLSALGGLSNQAGADCPQRPRGPSGNVLWTVRTGTVDRPACALDCQLKPTEPPVANPEIRTVRGEHADCPPGTRGPSASCCGLSETTSNQNSKPKWIESEAEQEHEEHTKNTVRADRPPGPRGPSTRHEQN